MLCGHFASTTQTFVQLQLTITELRDIKVQKIDQHSHTNMDGFQSQLHIYSKKV